MTIFDLFWLTSWENERVIKVILRRVFVLIFDHAVELSAGLYVKVVSESEVSMSVFIILYYCN